MVESSVRVADARSHRGQLNEQTLFIYVLLTDVMSVPWNISPTDK